MKLNGLNVDERIHELIARPDWPGRRTDSAWLGAFPSDRGGHVSFVQLCDLEQLQRENRTLQRSSNAALFGEPDSESLPGDVDPTNAYLIGFTDHCDSAIFVDLRPVHEPRIIYDDPGLPHPHYKTAFDSIAGFVAFYTAQHDCGGS